LNFILILGFGQLLVLTVWLGVTCYCCNGVCTNYIEQINDDDGGGELMVMILQCPLTVTLVSISALAHIHFVLHHQQSGILEFLSLPSSFDPSKPKTHFENT